MIKILGKLPDSCYIAVSGGSDSMAALDFIRVTRNVKVIHIAYGNDSSFELIADYCRLRDIEVFIHRVDDKVPKGVSREAHWRDLRYDIFTKLDLPVITAHNLDDCAESWIMGSCCGQPKLIPYRHKNVIRPFLLNRKARLTRWCTNRGVPFITENDEWTNTRLKVRNVLLPKIEEIYPGFVSMVRHRLEQKEVL